MTAKNLKGIFTHGRHARPGDYVVIRYSSPQIGTLMEKTISGVLIRVHRDGSDVYALVQQAPVKLNGQGIASATLFKLTPNHSVEEVDQGFACRVHHTVQEERAAAGYGEPQ